jgi:hypothetical protein
VYPALQQAYWKTLSLGYKLMIAENGLGIEVSADGSERNRQTYKFTGRLFTLVKLTIILISRV